MSVTRPKWSWHPPPPPSPRILHFPRHRHRKTPKFTGKRISADARRLNCRGKLESLFDEERAFSRTVLPIVVLNSNSGGGDEECERRERVEEEEGEIGGGGEAAEKEEKWRFQAEILRAECRFLRMEREVALKKLERNRVLIQRTLRSAVQALISERKKFCEGKSTSVVLDEEVKELVEKLEKLRSSRDGGFEVHNCSNFDKQASLLQKQIEKIGGFSDDKCVKEIREMAEASLLNSGKSFISIRKSKITEVEQLRRKMEGLSKGMLLKRMEEEYGPMLSTASSSASSSASTSMRKEFTDSTSSLIQQPCPETKLQEENTCTGRCKAVVRRIINQVRAETEQWSQMQEMLGQVREEMEELQSSRDFWEDRALDSEYQIQSLVSSEQEWRHKAQSSETKVKELQAEISILRGELQRSRTVHDPEILHRNKGSPLNSRDSQTEKEKRVLICRLKENHQTGENGNKYKEVFSDGRRKSFSCSGAKRTPFRDIGNSSRLGKQNSKAIFPLQSPEPLNAAESF